MTRPFGALEAESFESVSSVSLFSPVVAASILWLEFVFPVFVCAFAKLYFITIEGIMKLLWFCPHVFVCIHCLVHMHEGVNFGQVAFI